MADLEFNRGDIEGLTQKVAGLWPNLSAQERALLLAIFASAAEQRQCLRSEPASDIARGFKLCPATTGRSRLHSDYSNIFSNSC